MDIKNAFLNGILDEEVDIEQPPGFVTQEEYVQKVCMLKKSLYGMKQSLRVWFGCFASVISKFGLCRSGKDHFVFWRIQDRKRILLVVYVDDILIT